MTKILQFLLVLTLTNLLIVESAFPAGEFSVAKLSKGEEELADLESELRLRTNFISLMLQVGNDIDQDPKITNAIFNQPLQVSVLLQEKMKIYQKFYVEALNIPAAQKEIFKKTFLSLNWSKIIPIFKKTHIGIEVFFKKNGFGLGLAIMAGVLCEYVVPFVLYHIGLPHLIPVSLMVPWSTIYSFIPGIIHKLKIRNMLNESLGGKVQVQAYLKQQEILMKALHMQSPNDLIFPIGEIDGMVKSLVVPKVTWKVKLLQKIGFQKNSFGFDEMTKFLSANSISDPYVNWILENNRITKEEKTAFIAGHLLSLNDENITAKINQSFSENIITIKNSNHWEESWAWMQEMKKVKSLDELVGKIIDSPSDITTKEIAIIWEQILLPEYAVKFDLSYMEARRMFDNFEVLKARLRMKEDSVFDDSMKNEIIHYIKKITGQKSFSQCRSTPKQIAQFLLR
ncbi:MAG: hypothetical protein WC635_03030 [Bacteriovorax sp.]|jgi:hypothetical protein